VKSNREISDYDGVVIKNTYDGGSPSQWAEESKDDLTDVYIVFDAEQILDETTPSPVRPESAQ
jgi:hypothetical protein